ncbi:hypothetical protein PPERSA_08648 [Pseudocohnilembus persalinus]|uniref:Insulin-like growth factor binding protein, N-terminal n=1 Tax=Pseudocohnilembus persalinus TaxID=266149 RepID=A0A0V0R6T6_PSEPJ|nr:hypothetical protein PPERSA_08648 [Pseudocohnilembus persalinus]|eukprot:KRX10190.1 hypothetical protein PPERSA_08648 [Pseudocohnilembus persalinus]
MPSNDFECDDGNNQNGDGCSKYCTIEDGYTCMNSSKYSATVCQLDEGTFQTNFENGVKIFTNNEYNQQVNIVLTLNQELTYTSGKSIKDYLIVELEGVDDLEYEIISASNSDQSISISLTIPEAIINKEITIYFQNDSNFVTVMTDTDSKTSKSTLNLEYYAYYTDSQRSIAGALSKIYKYLLFLFMCFFFVLVFTNYFPLVHLTLDLLQLLNLYRWSQIKWPLNGTQFYNYNDHVFDWYLPSIFKEVFKNDNTDFDNYATYFEYDRDSYFWNNAGKNYKLKITFFNQIKTQIIKFSQIKHYLLLQSHLQFLESSSFLQMKIFGGSKTKEEEKFKDFLNIISQFFSNTVSTLMQLKVQ